VNAPGLPRAVVERDEHDRRERRIEMPVPIVLMHIDFAAAPTWLVEALIAKQLNIGTQNARDDIENVCAADQRLELFVGSVQVQALHDRPVASAVEMIGKVADALNCAAVRSQAQPIEAIAKIVELPIAQNAAERREAVALELRRNVTGTRHGKPP
jgi:hypothetical protein